MTVDRRRTFAHLLGYRIVGTAICVCLLAVPLPAAPPSATYFYPSGIGRGQTTTITVGGSFSDWPVELWSDRADLELKCDKSKGKISVTAAADAAPGVAWIRLLSNEGASSPRPLMIGTLPEMNEEEPNDELAKANEVSGATVVNGRLSKTGEVDSFGVKLTRGQTVVAMVHAKRGLGSPMDGVLQIVNADGFVLAQNDEGYGLDPLLDYTAPADGQYFVRLFAFPEVATSSINFAGGDNFVYRLTLSTAALADATLPLALQAGQTSQVRLAGWNIPATLAELPVAAPAEATTTVVAHPELGNWLTLPVTPYPAVVEQPAVDGKPQAVQLPTTISGRIAEPNESDTYEFAAKKGDKWSFVVVAHELGYPLDPQVNILDSDGKVVAQNDDGGRQTWDAEVSLAVPADGQYRLVVRDLFRHGGPRHFYRLTATQTAPDYSLSVSADSFVLSPGKPLEIPVAVSRKNNYASEITIAVHGLPEGVTVTAAKSAAKGDSSKSMKLVLKSDGEISFAGPVRIVGIGTDDAKTERAASAALTGLNASIESVWLTVAKKK